jgi:hypothetical protein
VTTEFYWHDSELACPNPCAHCRHDTVFHVGHQAGGWSFIFQTFDADRSPFGFPVLSRADWRKVLVRKGRILDEYGREVEDPPGWLDELVAPDAAQVHKETVWLGGWRAEDLPRDPEGFRIQSHQFD